MARQYPCRPEREEAQAIKTGIILPGLPLHSGLGNGERVLGGSIRNTDARQM